MPQIFLAGQMPKILSGLPANDNIKMIIDGLRETAVGNGNENSHLSERQF
jgi:hypothetical protein